MRHDFLSFIRIHEYVNYMFCLLYIKVKVLRPFMPLMKISFGLQQLIELFICLVQDEVIFSALHTLKSFKNAKVVIQMFFSYFSWFDFNEIWHT